MNTRKRDELELKAEDFERLLELVDVLDEVQLLRLHCKVAALIGEAAEETSASAIDTSRSTRPPPAGLSGPYGERSKDEDDESGV